MQYNAKHPDIAKIFFNDIIILAQVQGGENKNK
jgi:hypothetical protein